MSRFSLTGPFTALNAVLSLESTLYLKLALVDASSADVIPFFLPLLLVPFLLTDRITSKPVIVLDVLSVVAYIGFWSLTAVDRTHVPAFESSKHDTNSILGMVLVIAVSPSDITFSNGSVSIRVLLSFVYLLIQLPFNPNLRLRHRPERISTVFCIPFNHIINCNPGIHAAADFHCTSTQSNCRLDGLGCDRRFIVIPGFRVTVAGSLSLYTFRPCPDPDPDSRWANVYLHHSHLNCHWVVIPSALFVKTCQAARHISLHFRLVFTTRWLTFYSIPPSESNKSQVVIHIIMHMVRAPKSIVLPTHVRRGSLESDELLQRKETTLQRRRLGRRIGWDIGAALVAFLALALVVAVITLPLDAL